MDFFLTDSSREFTAHPAQFSLHPPEEVEHPLQVPCFPVYFTAAINAIIITAKIIADTRFIVIPLYFFPNSPLRNPFFS